MSSHEKQPKLVPPLPSGENKTLHVVSEVRAGAQLESAILFYLFFPGGPSALLILPLEAASGPATLPATPHFETPNFLGPFEIEIEIFTN